MSIFQPKILALFSVTLGKRSTIGPGSWFRSHGDMGIVTSQLVVDTQLHIKIEGRNTCVVYVVFKIVYINNSKKVDVNASSRYAACTLQLGC